VALGTNMPGCFPTTINGRTADDGWAGDRERVWRMPLGPEYDSRSIRIADMKNTGNPQRRLDTAAPIPAALLSTITPGRISMSRAPRWAPQTEINQ